MPKTHFKKYECYNPRAGDIFDSIDRMITSGDIAGAILAFGGKKYTIEEFQAENKNKLDILNEKCSICYEKVFKPVVEPACQNVFCGSCLFIWLLKKGSWPLCRKFIAYDELIYVGPEEKSEIVQSLPNKEEVCLQIIKPDKRVIIFSNQDDTIEPIRNFLRNNRIKFVEIRGSVDTRTKNLEQFRTGQVNVVFLNSYNDSAGVNLQEATDLIFYHSLSDTAKSHILTRANRIGRKEELTVHSLVYGKQN
jgi:SNF2 family DNA or RNA helicase